MGIWNLGPDSLAGARFVVSPLTETVSALHQLATGRAAPGGQAWLAAHRPRLLARLSADPFAAAFVETAFRAGWILDFISPPPLGGESFPDELARVRATPHPQALTDLATALTAAPPTFKLPTPRTPAPPHDTGVPPLTVAAALGDAGVRVLDTAGSGERAVGGGVAAVRVGGCGVPEVLDVPDLVGRAADLLAEVWGEAVAGDWERRRRIFEADIVARTHLLASSGWAAAVGDLRPGLRWLGNGTLQVNETDNPPRALDGAELLFVPVTGPRGWSCWHDPSRFALTYPCSGLLAERPPPPSDALSALLGPTRARVLTALGSPHSTTQLAALTGLPLATVGTQLRVLLDAGLLARRRAGRTVLYSRTALGDGLVSPGA